MSDAPDDSRWRMSASTSPPPRPELRDDPDGAGNAARHQWQRRPIPAEVLSPASRPNELAAAARGALIDPRDREILSRRLGLDGVVPQTLRMIAAGPGPTREHGQHWVPLVLGQGAG